MVINKENLFFEHWIAEVLRLLNGCHTCHLTGVGTGSVTRKHNTVHQMTKLRRDHCGQKSHISRM